MFTWPPIFRGILAHGKLYFLQIFILENAFACYCQEIWHLLLLLLVNCRKLQLAAYIVIIFIITNKSTRNITTVYITAVYITTVYIYHYSIYHYSIYITTVYIYHYSIYHCSIYHYIIYITTVYICIYIYISLQCLII